MKEENRYERPVKIADGIFWVGFYDNETNLHCNPYLVIEGDQAVLIDSGSRPDFAVVMMKILQTGIDPKKIIGLIYQHSDPDLCGSMANMLEICENDRLKIYSESDNKIFLNHYIERNKHHFLTSIEDHGFELTFNDRKLSFHATPYAHTPGSFITYDKKTKTLFTSDLFGSLSTNWELFTKFYEQCYTCEDYNKCPAGRDYCPLIDIIEFHRKIIPCEKALRYAMDVISKIDIEMIAPQHGGVFKKKRDIHFLIDTLKGLKDVGIDSVAGI